jgi:hypothetical protein
MCFLGLCDFFKMFFIKMTEGSIKFTNVILKIVVATKFEKKIIYHLFVENEMASLVTSLRISLSIKLTRRSFNH